MDNTLEEDFAHLVYARGFLLTQSTPIDIPKHWSYRNIEDFWFYFDPITSIATADKIIIFGRAVDLDDAAATLEEIAWKLARASDELRQTILDRLAGRFLIVRAHNGTIYLQQDAIGLRSVYHTDSMYPFVAGSHQQLLARQVAAPASQFSGAYLRDNNVQVYPGRMTQNLGIVRQLPNTEVDSLSRRAQRIFPREILDSCTADEAADYVINAVEAQLGTLEKDQVILASLSAGFDSRITMALLRQVQDRVKFFTYDLGPSRRNSSNEHDRSGALELVSRFKLNHTMIDIDGPVESLAFNNMMMKNTSFAHSRSIAMAYLEQLPYDALHIRSNAFEIARAHYRSQGMGTEIVTANTMRYIVANGKSLHLGALDAFAEYRTMTKFEDAVKLGYDGLDLFYWELRMGSWLAPVLHESDIANDTSILINSRTILTKLLGVPLEDRLSGQAFKIIILKKWREITEIPINGQLIKVD